MMNVPKDLHYTKSHEWVRLEAGGAAMVGITDYAQNALGDIVYAELPPLGKALRAGEVAANIESVKAVSEVFSPISGKIAAVNEKLASEPELLNKDPYGEWIFALSGIGSEPLLSPEEYAALL
jgi:glycine cleavage system H protein